MKQIDEIEKLSLEELERIASDSNIAIPEGIDRSIRTTLTAAEIAKGQIQVNSRRPRLLGAALYTAAAACIGLLVLLQTNRMPKDTFTDPMLAYAQIEQTFSYIESKMEKGLEIAAEAEPSLEKTNRIIVNSIK